MSSHAGVSGGAGADVAGSSLTNSGVIAGGSGMGNIDPGSPGASGGVGGYASGSSPTNSGTIAGGNGAYGGSASGGAGATGDSLAADSTMTNMGVIFGSYGGGRNTGSAGSTGLSGDGVSVANSTLINDGTILGVSGGSGDAQYSDSMKPTSCERFRSHPLDVVGRDRFCAMGGDHGRVADG
jgi:hypothetical protein